MNNQANTITRKITGGLYEVQHLPVDSNVYTSFYLTNEEDGWRITNEGTFCVVSRTKKGAIAYIKTITRTAAPHLFQN